MNTIQLTLDSYGTYSIPQNTIASNLITNSSRLDPKNNINLRKNEKLIKYQLKIRKLRSEIRQPCQPIKNTSDIQLAKDYLFNRQGRYSITNKRDYAIFVLMINIARRAGDVLNLKVKDILNSDNTFKKEIWMITQKRQKQEVISFSQSAQEALTIYFEEHPEILENRNNGLFPSRQSKNESMTYSNLYAIYKDIEKKINETKDNDSKIKIATHSPRRTWAYHTIQNNKEDNYIINHVSKALGHDSVETTRHYLGYDTETTVNLYQSNGL